MVPGVELCIRSLALLEQTPDQRGFNTTRDSFSWMWLFATCWWGFKLDFGILSLSKLSNFSF